jgi:ribonuclease HII
MRMLVCGVDEAGRGPVIGPLVLGCVVVDHEGAQKLRTLNVRDSKKLTASKREHLEPLIKAVAREWAVAYIEPGEIDRLRKTRSLNLIEAERTARMILALETKPGRIIVDAADTVEENYGRRITNALRELSADYRVPELVSEHKADDNYVEVSAASVLAKVARDRAVEALRAEHGDFGSGYPSDPLTKAFIRRIVAAGAYPDCVRRSWNTLERGKQASLGEYIFE